MPMISSRPGFLLAAALCVACAGFFVFTYNSGYGYDSLEYLLIGRSLYQGLPLFSYLPSKSPAIYYFVALLMKCGVSFEHFSLSIVITAMYAITVIATYRVMQRWFAPRVAVTAALLTGLAAPFMELNFFEPTAFLFLSGLAAFHAMLEFAKSGRYLHLVLAGAAVGVGLVVKASAAFYGLACALYLVVQWLQARGTFPALIARGTALAVGALAVVGAISGYFAARGVFSDFIEWTFIWPLFHYPANTTYLSKIYTKLLWVHVIILGCLPLLLSSVVRARVLRDPGAVLALLFGACAYLAVLKTQASHYFFPGAPFLMVFAVLVYDAALASATLTPRFVRQGLLVACGMFGVLIVSALLYRPDAVGRLARLRDFDATERGVREFIRAHVAPDHYVLFTGGTVASTWAYWISNRFPPPPFISADVKTIWMLRHEPERVFAVVDDPRLVLVQFELDQVEHPRMEDTFGAEPQDAVRMGEYRDRIEQRFMPVASPLPDETFWVRKGGALAAMR